MANFGLSELALAGVFGSDWDEAKTAWRSEAAVSGVDSEDIINNARVFGTLEEAAVDCDALFGTSSLHRLKPQRDVIPLSEAVKYAADNSFSKVGILFGPEKNGLTKEDLSFCSVIINIPTCDRQPSMNLGQSAAVIAYVLSRAGGMPPRAFRREPQAPPEEIYRFTAELQSALAARDGARWKEESQGRLIRQALTDARLTRTAINALKLLVK